MYQNDGYTDKPTHVRVFQTDVNEDGAEWGIDGGDDQGNYTPNFWSFKTHAEAVENIPLFIKDCERDNIKFQWRNPRERKS